MARVKIVIQPSSSDDTKTHYYDLSAYNVRRVLYAHTTRTSDSATGLRQPLEFANNLPRDIDEESADSKKSRFKLVFDMALNTTDKKATTIVFEETSKYLTRISACTNFVCDGFSDFKSYIQHTGITIINSKQETYNAERDGDDACIDVADILNKYNLSDAGLLYLKAKYPSYITNNNENTKFFTMLDTAIYPPDTYGYVGYVTLPFSQNGSPLTIILPGTTPHFNK